MIFYRIIFINLVVLLLNGCSVLSGGYVKPIQEYQGVKFLKRQHIFDVNMYRLSYECTFEQIKNKVNKDTTYQFYPMQNVLFKGDSLVSWIRLCDRNQAPFWKTFPPANPYTKELNQTYSVKNELACITDFKGQNIDLEISPDKYYYFIYYLKIGGIIGGPVSRKFFKRSLQGVQKFQSQHPVEIIFVNANPDKD